MPLISPHTKPLYGLVVSVLSVDLVISVLSAVAAANFGDPLPRLTPAQQQAFEVGREDFLEVEGVEDGLGLIEAIADNDLHQLAAQQPHAIKGRVHQVKDVGQPTRAGRFGHKAQAATLLQFAGDAYLNEMGITSPNFAQENCPNGDCGLLRCDPVADPEDDGSGVQAFADFMRLLAPPPRGASTPAVEAGAQVFSRIGCAGCHVPTLMTGSSPIAALNGVPFQPYSDFLLHDMGTLGDGIEQGQAGGTEMRTMPLWGLRTRTSFLHDGRTGSLTEAIGAHAGQGQAAAEQFTKLSGPEMQQLLEFLQSL